MNCDRNIDSNSDSESFTFEEESVDSFFDSFDTWEDDEDDDDSLEVGTIKSINASVFNGDVPGAIVVEDQLTGDHDQIADFLNAPLGNSFPIERNFRNFTEQLVSVEPCKMPYGMYPRASNGVMGDQRNSGIEMPFESIAISNGVSNTRNQAQAQVSSCVSTARASSVCWNERPPPILVKLSKPILIEDGPFLQKLLNSNSQKKACHKLSEEAKKKHKNWANKRKRVRYGTSHIYTNKQKCASKRRRINGRFETRESRLNRIATFNSN